MMSGYDSSWDDDDNEEAWEKKYEEWEKGDWLVWLKNNLSFPFRVKREEDEESFFRKDVGRRSFDVGHTMEALGIEEEDDLRGIIIKVREGKQVGYIPMCDVEIKPTTDKNFWPVREYVVWFANK